MKYAFCWFGNLFNNTFSAQMAESVVKDNGTSRCSTETENWKFNILAYIANGYSRQLIFSHGIFCNLLNSKL